MSMLGLNSDERGPGSLGEVSDVTEPHWFSFAGRINRLAYWVRSILGFLAFEAALAASVNVRNPSVPVMVLLIGLLCLSLWLVLATGAKRWHDLDHFGMLVLVSLIFTPAWIMVGFFRGDEGPNQYGADPRRARPPRPGNAH